VTIFSRSGKEVSFRDLGPGQLFGDLSAIDGRPRSASVVTLSEALIVSMPAEAFWEMLRDHPDVSAGMLKELAGLVRRLSDRVVEFSTLGVKNRIHAELLRLAREHMRDENSAAINPAPTHGEIASRVSTHREAVTRELNHLTQIGLIERRRGSLTVLDVGRLARLVEDVHGE
jgi:CRP-like cAMP-binding protein